MPSRWTRAQRHQEAARHEWAAPKPIKANRNPDRVRRKDWLRTDRSSFEALDDIELTERVMPRGEREWRQALRSTLAQTGEGMAAAPAAPAQEAMARGVVVEVATGLCRVRLDGRSLLCSLRGGLSAEDTGATNIVAVGDDVLVGEDGAGRGVVEAVLPRRSALARPDVGRAHRQQVVVANVDQLLIVASWREPALWYELLDRYLIAAARSSLAPVICLNKVDLAGAAAECHAALAPYAVLGYRIVLASALSGEGIEELRDLLRGRMTALAGLSGVGKSSLLAAVQPGLTLRTGVVSGRRHEGRHTTTQVTLHALEGGGYVADTPGIREFGLAGLRRGELARYYPEIAAVAHQCRFAGCLHEGRQPGCAVPDAVRSGRVAAVRYQSYRKIAATLGA
ncbi:MAG TPA: ribosome small subunit-dependent GTPase A [Anaerolineae bacterium]|nr:ribosome small subunit-dependent GTPase A [Anaerolineae bacterium]HPL28610.1 ribosome small subunit-dependent GTPase A [Anaerolineae bacterium]